MTSCTSCTLRDPHKYIASFHRPNLRYAVRECKGGEMLRLLLDLLKKYPEGNIIVYEPTTVRVEQTPTTSKKTE